MDEAFFNKRVKTFAGNIIGKGKTENLRALLLTTINTSCVYCEEIITVKNASLDHKTPYNDSKTRNKKTKETLEVRTYFDRIENLQFITKDCNFLKGNMNDIQFRYLLDFFEHHPDIKDVIVKRLNESRLVYTRFSKKTS